MVTVLQNNTAKCPLNKEYPVICATTLRTMRW